ncbi:MAG: ATP-binding protein [Mesorhizobium sp.]|uniref:AlbA family DNA-binding domain-containing protein n=1 Tax=unclassified Mesorhizobium TaxID=325217 RepID=UPI000F75A446|nr:MULTISPECIES: ATP-binding protein [unclassified Mesorhizobium]AZO72160.1 ATP-binding protein [Mesorhizobium sp. M1D.F.Ca.ET.043.01.1.1]RWA94943.1 MAG: ATP-binding protein [Mesorhizobium sp.]RWE17654.1 MAG: ATP-binding protein [Mesorhizobium sp.]TJW89853.1 MAG: ATP-binding protein [Mesorhizobium sp.]
MGRYQTEVEFVAAVLTRGAECTIDEIREMREYEQLGSLPAITKLVAFCEVHEIYVRPPLSEGELTDQRIFTRLPTKDEFSTAFESALARGECINVEFKQTLFLNVKRRENDPKFSAQAAVDLSMIHEVVKTITALMNTDGGTLLIGVTDSGDLYGVENEYEFLPGAKKDRDGWELFFWQSLENSLDEFGRCRGSISGAFVKKDQKDIFSVIVKPVGTRICICRDHAGPGVSEHVYVRSGNRSIKMKLREIEDLVIERTGRR